MKKVWTWNWYVGQRPKNLHHFHFTLELFNSQSSCQNSLVDHANFSFFMGKRISNSQGVKDLCKILYKGGVRWRLLYSYSIYFDFQLFSKKKKKNENSVVRKCVVNQPMLLLGKNVEKSEL